MYMIMRILLPSRPLVLDVGGLLHVCSRSSVSSTFEHFLSFKEFALLSCCHLGRCNVTCTHTDCMVSVPSGRLMVHSPGSLAAQFSHFLDPVVIGSGIFFVYFFNTFRITASFDLSVLLLFLI